jgi:hypothetical protein
MAGLQHTTLDLTEVNVGLAVFITPLAPFWRLGLHVSSLEVRGNFVDPVQRSKVVQELHVAVAGTVHAGSPVTFLVCFSVAVASTPRFVGL